MKLIKREADKMPETGIDSSIKEVSFDEIDVAFCEQKKRKLWVCRAVERSSNRAIGWCVGNGSTATFRRFYKKFEHLEAVFYSDDWESYSEVIPVEKHKIGKRYTIGIEQNNSNIRHFLGRFTRRTKMVLATLKICWYINKDNGFNYIKI
jgi:insertion element IS1 protein InsB